MADELNVPTHRWHVPQNNIALPNDEFSRDWIYADGIAKVDRHIARLAIDPLFANGEPGVALDPNDPATLFQDTAGTTPVTTPGQSVARVSDKSGRGNHATQATAGSRPVYALLPANGVRNLAKGSADVGNATFWPAAPVQNGITATKVASGFDTDGLPYVDVRYQGTATDTFHATTYAAGNSQAAAAAGQSFTASLVTLFTSGSLTGVTGISVTAVEETAPSTFVGQTLGNAVTSSVATISTATRTITTGNQARLGVIMSFTNGATIDATFRIKGLQFELGSTRTTYQFNYSNVNIAQPPFAQVGALLFDGVDDFLQTPSVDFSTTNKMTVFAGVRKLSDAAVGVVAELTVDSNSNPAFALFAPSGAGVAAYNFRSRGTLSAGATSATSFASPITNVLTGIGDISGDSSIIRVNGALSGNSASDQGTGNYSNAPIYIGRRAGTSLPFSGYLYGLIVRGAATTDADITRTEAWINSVTGAY